MSEPLDLDHVPPALREALRCSPDNVPLLLHVADTVLQRGRFDSAEQLFKRALALDPAHDAAKLGLATVFFQQSKRGEALVLVEALVEGAEVAPRALLLHARLAVQAGEPRLAAQQYSRARQADPSLTDVDLEQELSKYLAAEPTIATTPEPPGGDGDGEVDPLPFDDDNGSDDFRDKLPVGDLPDDSTAEIEQPKLKFADVGGMEPVKDEIRMKIILPLQQPELFKAYGKKTGGGILLYGPPGCGKTFLARATAGEVQASFISVGISDVLDMWIGKSERNLHAIFEQARVHRPCVLFFDEVDALGANRTDMLRSGGRHLINQFLSDLDGIEANNEGILVLGATNAPWHLDPAFRRPGRFDRILFVPPPDAPARAAILRLHLQGKPVDTIDFDRVAAKTDGYSGADLRAVVDQAVEEKLRAAMRSGNVEPLTARDLLAAVKNQRATVRDWFETARNYALYANQSGLYDDVLSYLKIKQ